MQPRGKNQLQKKQAMASLGASSEAAKVSLRLSALTPCIAKFWQKGSAGAAVGVQPASATACREIRVAAHGLLVVQHCHTHTLQRIGRHILESEPYWRERSKWRSAAGGIKFCAFWIELSRVTPGIANFKHHPRRTSGEWGRIAQACITE